MYKHHYSQDITAYATVAIQSKLLLYVEYLSKHNGVLKTMEVYPQTVYPTHIMVTDKNGGGIKRLNIDRIYQIGLEKQSA